MEDRYFGLTIKDLDDFRKKMTQLKKIDLISHPKRQAGIESKAF